MLAATQMGTNGLGLFLIQLVAKMLAATQMGTAMTWLCCTAGCCKDARSDADGNLARHTQMQMQHKLQRCSQRRRWEL